MQGDLPCLEELVFTGNPLEESLNNTEKGYRTTVQEKLAKLKKLDGNINSILISICSIITVHIEG